MILDIMSGGVATNIGRDVRRLVEVEGLLGIYSVDYVIEHFDYVVSDYGFTVERLREMAPACSRRARREREHEASIAELMNQVVGAEE